MAPEQDTKIQLERFELAAEATQEGLWDWNIASGEVYFSARWMAMLGYTGAALPADFSALEKLLHPEDREQTLKRIHTFLEGAKSLLDLKYRLRHQNGAWRWVHLRGIVQRDDAGKALRLVGSHADITDGKQVEAAMQDIQLRYRSLYDNAPLAFVLWNREGSITGWNRHAETLFGWSRQERFGSRFISMFPDDRHEDFARMARELVGGEVNSSQFVSEVNTKGGGENLVIEWSSVVLRNSRGAVSEVISLGLDLTQRIQAENELQRYRQHLEELVTQRTTELEQSQTSLSQIIADSPVPIFVIDRDRTLTHWNRACESSFGISAEEVIGSARSGYGLYRMDRPTLAELVLPGSDSSISALYGVNQRPSELAKGAHEAEIHIERIGRRFAVTAAPLYDTGNEIIGAIETLQDITERKRAEEMMLEAKQLAESAAKTKAEFLANMSHEIRTPMNAIIGISHLALKTDLSGKQRDYIEKIHGAGTMLLGLVNDVLDFSKIEAGMLKMESIEFTLDEVLNNVSTMVLPRAQQKALQLYFVVGDDVPQAMMGDPLRLTQILINLVGNAIKFTEHGHVTVSLELKARAELPRPFQKRRDSDWESVPATQIKHDRRGARPADQAASSREKAADGVELLVKVADTGIGMTEEQSRQLFKAFSQADTSTTRKFGGTGLGLIISKKIIEQMGGEIQLDSTPDVGTTFFFNAHFGQAAAQPIQTSRIPEALAGASVLVGDDDRISREVLAAILRNLGFAVTAVGSGEAMLKHMDEHPCRITFVDWQMPGTNGIEVARHIMQKDPDHRPLIILVSAHEIQEIEIAAGSTPIDGILSKPVTALQIIKLLREVAARASDEVINGGDADFRLEGLRVLVVDDIPTNQMIATEILDAQGIEVDVADDGLEAVSKVIHGSHYDAVLMDLQMPRMGGIEATQRIRADRRFSVLPIIAMTAHTLVEERDRCRNAGMNDFISKPFDPGALYAVLAKYCIRPVDPVPAISKESPKTAPSPAAEEMPELPGIDSAIGLKSVMNKQAFYVKVLQDFYHRFNHAVAEIGEALSKGDMPTAARQVHSAKGLSATIGALALNEAAVALEICLKEGGDSAAAMARFERELETVLSGLRAAFSLT